MPEGVVVAGVSGAGVVVAVAAGADFLVIGRPITRFWVHGAHAMAERARALAASVN